MTKRKSSLLSLAGKFHAPNGMESVEFNRKEFYDEYLESKIRRGVYGPLSQFKEFLEERRLAKIKKARKLNDKN